MKRTIPFLWLSILFLSSSFGADTSIPPKNIIKHFEWCATAKDNAALIARYESFWTRYHPKDEEYRGRHPRTLFACALIASLRSTPIPTIRRNAGRCFSGSNLMTRLFPNDRNL